MSFSKTLTADPCLCGSPHCKRAGIREMGVFYQGTGFEPDEFAELKRRWEGFVPLVEVLVFMKTLYGNDRERMRRAGLDTPAADKAIEKAEELTFALANDKVIPDGPKYSWESFLELSRRADAYSKLVGLLQLSRVGHRIDRSRLKEEGRSSINADVTISKIEETLTSLGEKFHDEIVHTSERDEQIDQLIRHAKLLKPYLEWTVGPESPGHHPTMPSAVACFLHSLERVAPSKFAKPEEDADVA